MECSKHPGRPMNVVCGEPVCGACYGERLMVERMPKMVQREPVDLSKGLFGRNEHYRPPVA